MSDKTETYDGSVWAQVNTMQRLESIVERNSKWKTAFGGVRVPGLVGLFRRMEWN